MATIELERNPKEKVKKTKGNPLQYQVLGAREVQKRWQGPLGSKMLTILRFGGPEAENADSTMVLGPRGQRKLTVARLVAFEVHKC